MIDLEGFKVGLSLSSSEHTSLHKSDVLEIVNRAIAAEEKAAILEKLNSELAASLIETESKLSQLEKQELMNDQIMADPNTSSRYSIPLYAAPLPPLKDDQ